MTGEPGSTRRSPQATNRAEKDTANQGGRQPGQQAAVTGHLPLAAPRDVQPHAEVQQPCLGPGVASGERPHVFAHRTREGRAPPHAHLVPGQEVVEQLGGAVRESTATERTAPYQPGVVERRGGQQADPVVGGSVGPRTGVGQQERPQGVHGDVGWQEPAHLRQRGARERVPEQLREGRAAEQRLPRLGQRLRWVGV